MILKKPYAFLIKYFKLIHLFITLLVIYLINKTSNIINFFVDYINDDILEVIPSNYVNIWIYLALFTIIGLVIVIIILMRKKDKPLFFYVMTILGYFILFLGFTYVGSVITSLQFNLLDRKTISFVRDISRFMLIGQYIFLIPYVIRTLGFDIKKFDFKRDLQELNISSEDNEEFEVVSPIDIDKVEKIGRKRLRELKYYYIENKLIILIILGIVSLFLGIYIVNVVDFSSFKKYDEKEVIDLNNYSLSIDDSYIRTRSDNGKLVAVNNKSYLIIKFNVTSNNYDLVLDINDFILKIGDSNFSPSKNYYNYFKAYGIGYKNQVISSNENKQYILVYNISNDYLNREMILEYNYSNKQAKIIKKKILLQPEKVN